ncbi:MAG: type II toxin-antitoxin system PemK/MazF family toxin [Dehalococcoidia bacterium]|nr:type II toxin-antitoxin system PemK/MazF family toxin [Dehalococcoidia bacterium]MSQ17113.1 type II toxin-antitoxin system PemK/MazF family toxin [Dehalococcoidia bacterium]
MKRGEVWWADLPPPLGHRPVVLLTRDSAYEVRLSVTVVPVTRRVRSLLAEVPLGPADGLPRPCAANADNINTVPKEALQEYIAALSAAKLQAMEDSIHFALGLER